jgi:hypothetical protein
MPARPDRLRLLSGSCPSARSFVPRFLPTVGRPSAVALPFVRCGQLTGGLTPPRLRPCWAHIKKISLTGNLIFEYQHAMAYYFAFINATVVSNMRLEKPHSLSYHEETFTKLPDTLVKVASKLEEAG